MVKHAVTERNNMSIHQTAPQTYASYSPCAVANCFLELSQENDIPVTNLKLQKLIYFANGLYLATTGVRLVTESFQAWTYGPVLASLYRELKIFGSDPITVKTLSCADVIPADTLAYRTIRAVWDRMKDFSAYQLVELTHAANSPWEKAIARGKFSELSDTEIIQAFKK